MGTCNLTQFTRLTRTSRILWSFGLFSKNFVFSKQVNEQKMLKEMMNKSDLNWNLWLWKWPKSFFLDMFKYSIYLWRAHYFLIQTKMSLLGYKKQYLTTRPGSGCGSVGRAVVSESRGLQFESSHRRNFIHYQLYWKVENKEKRGREWPIF